jgi:alpha-1,2-mannosyltransferase
VSPLRNRAQAIPTWVLVLMAGLAWLGVGLYMVAFGSHWFLDARVYRGAGHALFHGGRPYRSSFTEHHLLFTYPPFALLVLSLLSLPPLRATEALWWLVNSAALVTVVYLAARSALRLQGRRALAVSAAFAAVASIAFEPLRSNMDYGQINVILMLLVLSDLTVVRLRWRGVMVGIAAAIKVTPLVFVIGFVVRRDWASTARALGTFVAVTALAWLVLPTDSLRFWTNQLFDTKRVGKLGFVGNQSIDGLLHRSPFPHGASTYLWPLLVIATVMAGALLSARLFADRHPVDAVLALALTELLVSPISWTHHWSWIVLVPIVVVERWSDGPVQRVLFLVLAVVAVVAPYWWNLTGPLGHLAGDSLTLAGALVLFGWTIGALRHGRVGMFPGRDGEEPGHLHGPQVSLQ